MIGRYGMEKICEFCTALRPAVYCKADAAHLCLSCDAKVHSANELSSQHIRTLLCDSCRYRPAYVQCLDHRMFLCHGCDKSLHQVPSQHQKQRISCYMGCPLAKDFAALWGFDLNEMDNGSFQGQFVSNSCSSLEPDLVGQSYDSYSQIGGSAMSSTVIGATSVSGAESEIGPSSQQSEIFLKVQQQQNSCFILQQILDLKRLQLTGGNNSSTVICGQQTDATSIFKPSKNLDENIDLHPQHSKDPSTDFQQRESSHQVLKVEPFPLQLSQLEHLSSSTTAGIPLHGESFWQCRSPAQSSQLWSQNMQDLGVCEELVCDDDFDIPDVDVTFRNIEELFGGDQDPTKALLDVKNVSCSFLEKILLDQSDDSRPREKEDASMASCVNITQPGKVDKDVDPSKQANHFHGRMESPCPILPSYSTLSFSFSRVSAEPSAHDQVDDGLSPKFTGGGEPSCNSPNLETAHSEARDYAMMRYKEKKKARLERDTVEVHWQVGTWVCIFGFFCLVVHYMHLLFRQEKQIQCASHKDGANVRK